MSFSLPALPYELSALEPHISKETLEYHYGKHHKAYVDKLNILVASETQYQDKSLEEVILHSSGPVFNNAAQIWNHTFYWHCLSPQGGGKPEGALAKAIDESFGSFDQFKEQFTNAAINTFGSGWAWLVKNNEGKIAIVSTSNAQLPMTNNQKALLTCDVWEHAYYIDYRNSRPNYMDAFWKLVNWEFVAQNFGG
jgi:Fe-Mn family superoxide dismutase